MCVPALLMVLQHGYLQHERPHLILHLIWGKINPCSFSPISRSCLWEGSQSSLLARWGQPPGNGEVLQVKTNTYLLTNFTSISWRSLKLVPPLTDILSRQTLLIKVFTELWRCSPCWSVAFIKFVICVDGHLAHCCLSSKLLNKSWIFLWFKLEYITWTFTRWGSWPSDCQYVSQL